MQIKQPFTIAGCDSPKAVRQFSTGATRDTDNGKPEYVGFLSALVTKRFGEYMHENRKQKDGQLRAPDNWKKGMPLRVYAESLRRHEVDLELHLEGFGAQAREDMETALCAILFNAQGMLYEILKEKACQTPIGMPEQLET